MYGNTYLAISVDPPIFLEALMATKSGCGEHQTLCKLVKLSFTQGSVATLRYHRPDQSLLGGVCHEGSA